MLPNNVNEKVLRNYARLILQKGVNIKEKQNLVITGEPVHWWFYTLLAEEAYKMGVAIVQVEANHPALAKARYNYSRDEFDDLFPSFTEQILNSYINENWAFIRIHGEEDPDIFAQCDKAKKARIIRNYRKKTRFFHDATSSNKLTWNVSPLPTMGWAKKVYPELSNEEALKSLWNNLISFLRLDYPDPLSEWQKLSNTLQDRANKLNNYRFDYLHFTTETNSSQNTDLKIYLSPLSVWKGGSAYSQNGVEFMPNLPTEEVFTSPDYRKTTGRVRVTRPVMVMNELVEGITLEFSEGKVIKFSAEKGEENLRQFFEMDQQARFLGEVALVDINSPIYRSGRIFQVILLDENAACHIALGSGYTECMKGTQQMTENERLAVGLNQSIVHTDFMIGSEQLNVDGYCNDGKQVPILRKGKFVI